MPEFKSKEEYEKWKAEKAKQPQQNKDNAQEIKQPVQIKARSPYAENKFSKKKIFLIIGIFLIVLIPAIYSLWSYMTHAKLSGNVYLTMKSGDIKKAAGIGVYLLKVDDKAGLNKKLGEIKEEAHRTIFDLSYDAKDMQLGVDVCEKEPSKDEFCQEYLQKYKGILAKIEGAREKRNSKVMQLFEPLIIAQTVTDINGFYQLSNFTRSKYYIFASYSLFDNHIVWVEPIEINQRKIVLDLNNDNRSLSYYWEQD